MTDPAGGWGAVSAALSPQRGTDAWSSVRAALGAAEGSVAEVPGTAATGTAGPPATEAGAPDGSSAAAAPQRPGSAGYDTLRAALAESPGSTDAAGSGADEVAAEVAAPPAVEVTDRPARRRRRRRIVAAGAAAVVVAGAAAGVVALVRPHGLGGDVAFVVDGTKVTKAQFSSELSVRQTLYGITPPAQTDVAAYRKYLASAAQAEAVSLLLDKLAPAQGVTVSQQAASQQLDKAITTQYGGQSGFASALSAAGLNQQQVLTEVQHNLVYQGLFAKIVGTPTVTDAQVQAWFTAHTAQLAIPETRQISHIVVASEATANALLAQLKGGASFASLASQSLDTTTAANGGQLGLYAAADLKPAFATPAFAAAPNVPFGPVQEGSGPSSTWEIGVVTAVHPAAPATLDATTSAAIKTVLTDQAEVTAWDTWLGGRLRSAHITYAAAYRPANPTAPPTIPVPNLTGETLAGVGTASPAAAPSGGAAPSGVAAQSGGGGAASSPVTQAP